MNSGASQTAAFLTPEERSLLARAIERRWRPRPVSQETRNWLLARDAVRRVLRALLDGTSPPPLPSAARLLGRMSCSPRFWRWGPRIWNAAERKALASLDIAVPSGMSWGVPEARELLLNAEAALSNTPDDFAVAEEQVGVSSDLSKLPADWRGKTLLSSLRELQKADLPGLGFYIHGSMASFDGTDFSDVDDLIVAGPELWNDAAALTRAAPLCAEIARKYQEVDPFQHHGHFLAMPCDLACCDESVMPLAALNPAISVCGPKNLRFMVTDGRGPARETAWKLIRQLDSLLEVFRAGHFGAYHLKLAASSVALIPALLLQASGRRTSKPVALARAAEDLGEEAGEAIAWATRVRASWDKIAPVRFGRRLMRAARIFAARRYQAQGLAVHLKPVLCELEAAGNGSAPWQMLNKFVQVAARNLLEIVRADIS